ncbi:MULTISPECIES: hypothetical protein [Listeria]|uniref:hypothetical protein n=1 Tax=Listeria TaxID=1637 RepID=UPI000775ADCA|nr:MULTISPECIES: hypothetical protein [Listeria]EIM0412978.1 hypothetical protein [Listeria monocytogenes]EIM0799665.1 hypothetical protein [Listeria monocytogenes]EIM1267577.1 hypothetical protein [Listeria monocytogenes]KXS60519.1 hypothetical protein AWJ01_05610 [Listeria monocytogenes]MBF2456550.1 hypothetical protein [Listeria welshimeri]
MIKAATFLLSKKIIKDKNFYIQVFIRMPFSLILPIYFMMKYVEVREDTVIISLLFWSFTTAVIFESFFFTKYELDSDNRYLIQLSGINFYWYHFIINTIICLFMLIIYVLLILLLPLFNIISFNTILMIFSSPFIPILTFTTIVFAQFINFFQIFMGRKMMFNLFNLFMDILILVTGVMFPITLFGEWSKILYLFPFTYPFQLILQEKSILFSSMESWGISIIILSFISFFIFKRNRGVK